MITRQLPKKKKIASPLSLSPVFSVSDLHKIIYVSFFPVFIVVTLVAKDNLLIGNDKLGSNKKRLNVEKIQAKAVAQVVIAL